MQLMSEVISDLETTLFEVKPSRRNPSKLKGYLKPAFASSTLTWAEWSALRPLLFEAPSRDAPSPEQPTMIRCGRTLVMTMSAKPQSKVAAECWDAEQFSMLQDAFRVVLQRSQHKQVAALLKVAREVRKLDQVRFCLCVLFVGVPYGCACFFGPPSNPPIFPALSVPSPPINSPSTDCA
jgi:hypothetical protein